MACPPTPIKRKHYVDAGIPWFDTYRDFAPAVPGGRDFGRIESVAEIDDETEIKEGTSVAETRNVACTMCRKNLCDCVLRPCCHAFCVTCVQARMLRRGGREMGKIDCWECGEVATQMLGFSAPMALPGEENFEPDVDAVVVIKAGVFGKAGFMSELE